MAELATWQLALSTLIISATWRLGWAESAPVRPTTRWTVVRVNLWATCLPSMWMNGLEWL
ncbi:hypothetical protein D3C78_1978990 [compost metagenome]